MEELKNPDIVDHNFVRSRIKKLHASFVKCECRDCGCTLYPDDAEDIEYAVSGGREVFICKKNVWRSVKRCGKKRGHEKYEKISKNRNGKWAYRVNCRESERVGSGRRIRRTS